MTNRLPHPIPYQGSKRSLAPLIGQYIPTKIHTFFEPFAGSAAMTIFAAKHRLANKFVIGDSLAPIIELWRSIVTEPHRTSQRYRILWEGQRTGDPEYYYKIRDRYNVDGDPVYLLYLICRCVKNAVRFNRKGNFTQSVDKRRLGMQPNRMERAIIAASALLDGRIEFRVGDWLTVVADARVQDFIYMDPPYLGTTIGHDKRYHEQLSREKLIDGLRVLSDRKIRFALSYDGMTGEKEYGPALPENLNLTRLLLHAGTSSQATLMGLKAETVESLYLSAGLSSPVEGVIRFRKVAQETLPFIDALKMSVASSSH